MGWVSLRWTVYSRLSVLAFLVVSAWLGVAGLRALLVDSY
jgi:hypothetical protein